MIGESMFELYEIYSNGEEKTLMREIERPFRYSRNRRRKAFFKRVTFLYRKHDTFSLQLSPINRINFLNISIGISTPNVPDEENRL